MRIAVSGTHCCGKSTLVDEFLQVHPDFAHEPEPYNVLVEDYGEEFCGEPCADDFYRQLEFNVARFGHYKDGERVIYERSPVDFLAYIRALRDYRGNDASSDLVEAAHRMVLDAMVNLDVVVFLPLDADGTQFPVCEHLKLRTAVDSQLEVIFDELDLGQRSHPVVVEAKGSTAERLQTLEDAMRSFVA